MSLNNEPTTSPQTNIQIANNIPGAINTNETQSINKCCSLLGMLMIIGILGCAITYIVYVIMSLSQTSYSEQKKLCEKSNAWLYLLLGMIINAIVGSYTSIQKSSDDNNKLNRIYLKYLTCVVFTIWGCVELFSVNCVNELNNTLLYTMLEVSVICNIIITGIFMFVGLGFSCMKFSSQ